MSRLHPQPLSDLLRRAAAEWTHDGRIFDLPERSFWRGSPLDLSVRFHGRRAATPAGPAAGPHTQLAQNIALGWLAGARFFELKTVQVEDRIRVPRPCIDAPNVAFNVEWSQELTLEESQPEYAKAWYLIHALARLNPAGIRPAERDAIFEVSLGYSLAGIGSDRIARWLDGLRDAHALIARLRDGLGPDVRWFGSIHVPPEVCTSVTLSTFHGCPPDEIERIVEMLFERHGVDVVVKLNPTLLGVEAVESILHDRLGYREIRPHRPAFEGDLRFEDAAALLRRLEGAAARAGRRLGVKLANTLVVENHRAFFPPSERVMYLSGAPLHVLAIDLARRLDEALDGRLPLSFSGGIDRANFGAAVACGLVPVTACTDLLRPGGYSRIGGWLEGLEAEMRKAGAETVPELVERRGGARRALADYAARALEDARYSAERNSGIPRRTGGALELFDCLNCMKCVPTCPNDANFAIDLPAAGRFATLDLVVGPGGKVEAEPGAVLEIEKRRQIANFADSCNECGNCDVFCPETGGPYRTKPRFFSSIESYRAAPGLDGFVVEPGRMTGRIEGVEHRLEIDGGRAAFADGFVTARFDAATGALIDATARPGTPEGHRLLLRRYHVMRALYEGVLAGVNPVSAAFPADPVPVP